LPKSAVSQDAALGQQGAARQETQGERPICRRIPRNS